MKAKEIEQLDLSSSETRDIVTPYAFKIDQALLGLPLATPVRRALAIIIDVSLIFLAAKISAAIIAFLAALAFYRGTAEKHLPAMSKVGRRTLKISAASILFISSLLLLAFTIDFFEGDKDGQIIQENKQVNFNAADKQKISDYLQHIKIDENCDEICQSEALSQLIDDVPKLQELADIEDVRVSQLLLWGIDTFDEDELSNVSHNTSTESSNSILKWGKGIIEDLGLGFGWAAVYFTLFSLLWNGQTPGKKLCDIRVVALRGDKLNLWDAFIRYGGYGAGFATGLLGFLQIYWDPNRQAIQDKISATVVIKGNVNQTVNKQTIEETVQE
jgi:uncharacterized RDD family membrane protein YckC